MPTLPAPRSHRAVNWLGLWSLIAKDVRRGLKGYRYSVLGPVVSNLLFLTVFALARSHDGPYVGGLSFIEFLVPGLIIFAACERAYGTSSESVLFDKMEGMIADTLMAPLTAIERTVGYACSSATMGLVTGAATAIPMLLLVDLPVASLPLICFFAVAGTLMHGLFGVIVGLWAERWDHYAAALTFLVIPFGFLSGTFYSIATLPEIGARAARLNPMFYVIDGFRAGSTGHADGSLGTGIVVVLLVIIILGAVTCRLFRIGYKIKP